MRARQFVILSTTLTTLVVGPAAVAAPEQGQGSLQARGPDGVPRPFVLRTTEVEGSISGPVAGVRVTQVFDNPYDETVEATYSFPLPDSAAVDAFELRLGKRVIKGVLERRDDARDRYERAKSEGKTAALLDQERPNIFTVSVANILPRERVDVSLHYVDVLEYERPGYRFSFPMTIGPRFSPGGASEGVAVDAPGAGPVVTPLRASVSPPWTIGGRSGHDIRLRLTIDAAVPIEAIASRSHAIEIERRDRQRAVVKLAARDSIPNRDFVLDVHVAGGEVRTGAIATRTTAGDGHFMLVLQPQSRADVNREVTPKEMVFVLDTSCSMGGQPIEAAKAVMREAVMNMNPDDAFTVLGFDNQVSALGPRPIANTPANVTRGLSFIDQFHGAGGTYMNAGIRAALTASRDPRRMRMVFFMTDGYIGDEGQIFATIQNNLDEARIFAFGVGGSVNRYLINGMSDLGRGVAEDVPLSANPKDVASKFYDRIRKPVLTSVDIDFGELEVTDVLPKVIPDLFEAKPVIVVGRYRGAGEGKVRVRGSVRGEPVNYSMNVRLPERTAGDDVVARLWGRRKLAELEKQGYRDESPELIEEMTDVALKYGLMSKYTSFVAVAHEVRADPSRPGKHITVPVELPKGVDPAMVGGRLSRTEIPPGDPIISVRAPADARRVTAYFPFGLTKRMTFDPSTQTWRARFLVPKGVADGLYQVTVVVEDAQGAFRDLDLPYRLDSSGPDMTVDLAEDRVAAGGRLALEVEVEEPAGEVTVFCEALSEEQVPLESSGVEGLRWKAWLQIPGDVARGSHELTVVARDRAGNRSERKVIFEIR